MPMQLNGCMRDHCRKLLSGLTERVPGFRPRSGQNQMIADVANVCGGVGLEEGEARVCVIEGQTGVGKSLGYLLPMTALQQAFTLAREEAEEEVLKVQLVVATANVGLQLQLFNSDLPMLARAGMKLKTLLVAGRGRYFCRLNADKQLAGAGQTALMPGLEQGKNLTEREQRWIEQAIEVSDEHWDGLRDNCPVTGVTGQPVA